MEHIVLGLLILKDMTMYELNGAFHQGLYMIYAASYGSLQHAVNKLLKNNLVTYVEKVENGRNKKIYKINKAGIDEFYTWMMDDIDSKHIETLMLSKIYFMGLIESDDDKKAIIDKILKSADEYSKELSEAKEAVDNIQMNSEYMKIAKYQFATLDYGIGAYEFSIEWLKKMRESIE